MKTTPLPGILRQIASITAMEPGHLSVIREGPNGPYYNLQHRENGRNVTEYVPSGQVAEVERNIAAYQEFTGLVEAYAGRIVEETRRQRHAGLKKKRGIPRASKSAGRRRSAT
jgi:hypothetical protein